MLFVFLFASLDSFPLFFEFAFAPGCQSIKNMGMAADHFSIDRFEDVFQGEMSFIFIYAGGQSKDEKQVKRIVTGPKGAICDECVSLCSMVIESDKKKSPQRA